MARSDTAPEHAVLVTTDPHEAEYALSETYLPVRIQPQAPQPKVDFRLHALSLGVATAGTLRYGVPARITTATTTNYHLDIAITGRSVSATDQGDIVITPGQTEVVGPGTAGDLRWSSDTEHLCIMLDKDAVERRLTAMLGRDLRQPLSLGRVFDLRAPAAATWRQTLSMISHETRAASALLTNPLTRETLGQLLVDGLLTTHPHNYTQLLQQRPLHAKAAVNDAVALLEARPDEPWTTARLAAAVGVGPRAVQNGVRAATGMGPMTYLKAVRLQQVHEQLLAADPDRTSVAAIARRWGFTHLGRFAAHYRRRYGELPSETLRS